MWAASGNSKKIRILRAYWYDLCLFNSKGINFRFLQVKGLENNFEIKIAYQIDLERESESNIQFNVSKDFQSKYLLNEINYKKSLNIVSDVSPEDILFNWPIVISMIVVIGSLLLLYIPLGFCWFFLHKKRFEPPVEIGGNFKKDESDDENKRLNMIELQAYHRESEQENKMEKKSQGSQGDYGNPINPNNELQQYDLNTNPIIQASSQAFPF